MVQCLKKTYILVQHITATVFLTIPTFTLADDAGKVTRISVSNEEGGINRSPFFTAPFIRIVRAFGEDKILQQK